jgi:hypothetical protein
MAHLGSIPLVTGEAAEPAGAAFTLSVAATESAVLAFEGAVIQLRQAERNVVVRFTGARDSREAFDRGHELAQKGLDLLSVRGLQDAVIHDAEDEHSLWWTEQVGLVVRDVSTNLIKLRVGPATLTVRDADGNAVPPRPPMPPRHHIAFRYFRLAQTTDDLFDAYRNMYLALEVLLSEQTPVAKGQWEQDWLRAALTNAMTTIPLNDLRPGFATDPVGSVINAIYKDARLPLFHAKTGRDAPGRGRSRRAASSPSSTQRWRMRCTVAMPTPTAAATSESERPSSAFSSTRARVMRRAPWVPARIIWVNPSRSAALRLTTYFGGAMASSLAEDAMRHLHAGCHCYHIYRDWLLGRPGR